MVEEEKTIKTKKMYLFHSLSLLVDFPSGLFIVIHIYRNYTEYLLFYSEWEHNHRPIHHHLLPNGGREVCWVLLETY